MNIWVDADACPVAIKEMLFRAAARTGVQVILVANHAMRVPALQQVTFVQVEAGFDAADNEIVRRLETNDLVITSDIPLAAEILNHGGLVLSPRGERMTKDNVGPKLNMRDFMDTMRASGVATGGPAALNQADKKAFAGQLDKILAGARRSP
ncbi:MAG: YaiI/YqxD family protein [Pseudomonadota bacterium]